MVGGGVPLNLCARGTVRLTSTGNPVSGNQEFCLALSSKTMVEQVKNKKSHMAGHGLRIKTSGDMFGL